MTEPMYIPDEARLALGNAIEDYLAYAPTERDRLFLVHSVAMDFAVRLQRELGGERAAKLMRDLAGQLT